MRLSQRGLDAIKEHEGLRLRAYDDGVGVLTIGYGHTAGVRAGDQITAEQAEQFLREDVQIFEKTVHDAVHVSISQAQFDALVSLVFNIGAGAFRRSTLLAKLNAGDYSGAAQEFVRWNQAGGRVLAGLTRRRLAERDLFTSQDAPEAPTAREPEPAAPTPPPTPKGRAMAPILAALLPSLISAIPRLASIFKPGSEVAERNVRAVTTAFEIAKDALGAANEQEVVTRIQSDPAAAQTVTQAIESRWIELTEAGGGGITGARAADAETRGRADMLHSPSFWISLALLPLVYMITANLIGVLGASTWSDDARAGLAGSIVGSIIGGIVGYFFGQTTTRNRTPAA